MAKKAALIQMKASTDKQENLQAAVDYVARAARRGASLCAFPEFMMFYTPRSQRPAELAALAERTDGPFVSEIARAAREHSIEVVGTMYERGPGSRVYDTSFLLSRAGRLVSSYRKTHLYDALGFRESAKLAPGKRLPSAHSSGIGKLGMLICYDLRFPEVSRGLAAAGAHVLVAPSAWVQGDQKEEHWMMINRTRAVENGCFVLAPDHVGNGYCGRSVAVDPFGRVLLDMKKRRGIGVVEIDPGLVSRTRRGLPLLRGRRTDLYADLAGRRRT